MTSKCDSGKANNDCNHQLLRLAACAHTRTSTAELHDQAEENTKLDASMRAIESSRSSSSGLGPHIAALFSIIRDWLILLTPSMRAIP